MPPVVQDAYINYKMRIVIYNIIQGGGGTSEKGERKREKGERIKKREKK